MAGLDTFTAAHHANFNVSDYLDLSTEVELLSESIASATIAAHYSGSLGYKLELAPVAGTLNVLAYANGVVLRTPWQTA